MLNNEGWYMLMILIGWCLCVLPGVPFMRRENTMVQRLQNRGGALDTAGAYMLRGGVLLALAVLPGMIYQDGLLRAVAALSAWIGMLAGTYWLLPGIRKEGAWTVFECLSANSVSRALLALCGVFSTFFLTGAALSLAARWVAGAFSLHSTIALGMVTALSLALTYLLGNEARRRTDRLQAVLLIAAFFALTMLLLLQQNAGQVLSRELLADIQIDKIEWRTLGSDMLWGIGTLGLMLPAQRIVSIDSPAGRRGGRIGAMLSGLLLLLSVPLTLLGREMDKGLLGAAAAETIFQQAVLMLKLPGKEMLTSPAQGIWMAVPIIVLILYVQDGLRRMADWLSWDVIQPLTGDVREKPLRRAASWIVLPLSAGVFCLAMDAQIAVAQFVQAAFLLAAPLTAGAVWVRTGGWIDRRVAVSGLAAGETAAILWLLLPTLRELGMWGILPVILLTWIGFAVPYWRTVRPIKNELPSSSKEDEPTEEESQIEETMLLQNPEDEDNISESPEKTEDAEGAQQPETTTEKKEEE